MSAKTDTKRILIDTTKTILCQQSEFTVKEITEKAFTNVAAINYHFGDKKQLIRIAISELIDELKEQIILSFTKEFAGNKEALEYVIEFLLDIYGEYKGAIKYILMTHDEEGESRFIEQFFFDYGFNEILLDRMSNTTGETDRNKLFYKYSITVSAFLFSLLLEGKKSSVDDRLSLTALQKDDNKKAFIETLMLLYKD